MIRIDCGPILTMGSVRPGDRDGVAPTAGREDGAPTARRTNVFPMERATAEVLDNRRMVENRLPRQIAFLTEVDKLKQVLRRTTLMDASRRENSAEHSWHLVLAALVVREHAAGEVDLLRVLEMLAVHDLVEIDAGDTFAYDADGLATKAARELAAAERIFGLLPADQTAHFRALWEEFETYETPESRFANALDRLQPLLQNAGSGGGTWRTHGLSREAILERMGPVQAGLPALWPTVIEVVDAFCAAGVIGSDRS
jgi:putative hydrolase of HD superfamily